MTAAKQPVEMQQEVAVAANAPRCKYLPATPFAGVGSQVDLSFSTAAESTSSSLLHMGCNCKKDLSPISCFCSDVSPLLRQWTCCRHSLCILATIYRAYTPQKLTAAFGLSSCWQDLCTSVSWKSMVEFEFWGQGCCLFCCGSLTDCFRAVEK